MLDFDMFTRYRRLCFRCIRRINNPYLYPAIESVGVEHPTTQILCRAPQALNWSTHLATGRVTKRVQSRREWPSKEQQVVPSPFELLDTKEGHQFIDTVVSTRVLQGTLLFTNAATYTRVDVMLDELALLESPSLRSLLEIIGNHEDLYWRLVDQLTSKTLKLARMVKPNVVDEWAFDGDYPREGFLWHSRYSDLRVLLYLSMQRAGVNLRLADRAMSVWTLDGPQGLCDFVPSSPRELLDCLIILNGLQARESCSKWLATCSLAATSTVGTLRDMARPLNLMAA
ncbi:MAG: uncharacterized protein KVP18_000951 [Porospora cf. gigantea A]|nr:MAG: hypothetical protein KVP18_000951 [Porospora cf. gigantea A]